MSNTGNKKTLKACLRQHAYVASQMAGMLQPAAAALAAASSLPPSMRLPKLDGWALPEAEVAGMPVQPPCISTAAHAHPADGSTSCCQMTAV